MRILVWGHLLLSAACYGQFLYTVDSKIGSCRTHLLGTVHFGVAIKELPDAIDLLQKSGGLMVESPLMHPQLLLKHQSSFLQPENGDLSQLLQGKDLERVLSVAESMGIPRSVAVRLIPTILIFFMLTHLQPCMEFGLIEAALELNLPIETLDLPEYDRENFLTFLKMEGEANTAQSLVNLAHQIGNNSDKFALFTLPLRNAYLSGNVNELMNGVLPQLTGGFGGGELSRVIGYPRHIHWYRRIEAFRKKISGPPFVAVGAAHLLLEGWKPMLENYEQQDFTITRIQSPMPAH